jgi:hypothetical protein
VVRSAGEQTQAELHLLGVLTGLALLSARSRQSQDVAAQPFSLGLGQPLLEMGASQVFMHELLHLSTP